MEYNVTSNKVSILKPGKGVYVTFLAFVKHTNNLSEEEKALLVCFKDTLYIEMRINGKAVYAKLN